MKACDIPMIAELERRYFPEPWSEASLRDVFSDSNYLVYVCREGDRVIGYCGLLCTPPEGEIVFICTEEAYRRQGVGDTLLKRVLSEGKKKDITKVFLEVRQSNLPAQRLYEKYGFTAFGLRKNYYRNPLEHAVLMQLDRLEEIC